MAAIEALPEVTSIGKLCSKITSGYTPTLPNLVDGDIDFVTLECLSPLRFDNSKLKKIPRSDFEAGFQQRRAVTKDTVLSTIKRRICQAYPFLDEPGRPLAFNQDVALLRPKLEEVSGAYLAAYLGCNVGQAFANREQTEQMNPYLSLDGLRRLPIIVASSEVQQGIEGLIRKADQYLADASAAQNDASDQLLDALGLCDWRPPEPLTYTRAASAVVEAGRLDAQFHAPAVLALRARLEQKFELTSLGALGDVTNGRTVQYSEQGSVPIMRSGDVGKARDLTDLLRAEPSEAIFIVERGDVLISSIGFGSIGRVEAIDTDAALGTVSEVTVVRQSKLDAHYLAAFLRSFAGQVQLERLITGATGQLHLYPRDVRTVFVPVLGEEAQQAQRTWAEAANAPRVRSAQLLDAAKRAVEIAIEQDETRALRFIAEQGER